VKERESFEFVRCDAHAFSRILTLLLALYSFLVQCERVLSLALNSQPDKLTLEMRPVTIHTKSLEYIRRAEMNLYVWKVPIASPIQLDYIKKIFMKIDMPILVEGF
jgi:hypothetical protein